MSWRLGARERRAHALAQRARHVARAQHEALHERSHAVAREAHVQHDRHVRLERAAGARRRGGARERFEARVERVNDMRERDAAVARGVEDERRLQHEGEARATVREEQLGAKADARDGIKHLALVVVRRRPL